jgi:hypothetical protein
METQALQTIDLDQLSLVTGGDEAPPANRGVNEETYRYYGREAGRAAGEVLNSPTLSRHLSEAGEQVGRGLYNAGSWLGTQVGNWLYPQK